MTGRGVDDASGPALQLRMSNDVASLCGALVTVDEFLDRHRVGAEAMSTLRLAAEEIVTNVIKYAYADSARHEIELDLRLSPELAVLRVTDDGRPFDPLAAASPDLSLPVETKGIGGVGIHLLRNITERLEYARVGDRNLLVATVRLESRR